MKTYNFRECECEIHGIPFFDKKNGEIKRINDKTLKTCPNLRELAYHPTGSRLCFKTDSSVLKLNIMLDNVYVDRGMSFYQANVGAIYVGPYSKSDYYGILSADKSYDENEVYGTYNLPEGMNNITVFLPRNPTVLDITITVDDDAAVLPPEKFSVERPFLFYGSSIVENGHTSSQNAYAALLSRWFDADFYNLGFSGSARGEEAMAEYCGSIDCSIFFYDYDHNAPTAEHLESTHEKFFRIFREKHPNTPVVMSTRPAEYEQGDEDKRIATVRATYENAVKYGDKNVYFIDGRTFFPDDLKPICTTDNTHPNDLGHYFMAKKIAEVIRENDLIK